MREGLTIDLIAHSSTHSVDHDFFWITAPLTELSQVVEELLAFERLFSDTSCVGNPDYRQLKHFIFSLQLSSLSISWDLQLQ